MPADGTVQLISMKKRIKEEAKRSLKKEEPRPVVPPLPSAPMREKEAEMPRLETAPQQQAETVAAAQRIEAKAAEPQATGDNMKTFAVLVLFVVALILAYYFFVVLENTFATGPEVDVETFKEIFINTSNVFIVMDVRGASNDVVSNNIIQCGVDFAQSSGMGGKMVTPMSIYQGGCIAPDGNHTIKECYGMLKDGIAIYVKEGPGGAKYYTNGMIVMVGQNYTLGTCGIKWV